LRFALRAEPYLSFHKAPENALPASCFHGGWNPPIPAFIMESERHAVLTPFLSFGKAVKRSNECIDQASFVYSVSYLNNSGFLWVFMLK